MAHTQNHKSWYPAPEAVLYLNRQLKLPATGTEQDWEIELSDSKRIEEFLNFFEKESGNVDVQRALTALILASFEEAYWNSTFDSILWTMFSSAVEKKECSPSSAFAVVR